jgi:TatD DNase family protein
MPLIDTHCHFDFDVFDADRDALIEAAKAQDVTRLIIPGTEYASSEAAVRLARQYPEIYAAVGVHPNSAVGWSDEMLAGIEYLAQQDPKVVAIGEIGLDYYWDDTPTEIQWQAFKDQLALAARLDLPVIIHNREASEDVIRYLREWVATLPDSLKTRPGVLHSFSADWSIAQQALDMGFYLGFTGPITFKKADELRAIARQVPLDRILVETDAPYLTPHPHRGKRNEPSYVRLVAEKIAELHGLDFATFAQMTTANAERLFTRLA